MPCVYEFKPSYSDRTIKLLYGLSGNRCAHPDCVDLIIADSNKFDDAANLSNISHIYSAKSTGPRPFPGDTPPSEQFISGFQNLILLCGYHHALADKQESTYSAEELREWKTSHLNKNLLTRKSSVPESQRSQRIFGAEFKFYTVDATTVSIGYPSQERVAQVGYRPLSYSVTRVWFERYDGYSFSLDFRNMGVPCRETDRVSFVCSSLEGRSELFHEVLNHRSRQWVELPMKVAVLKNLRTSEIKLMIGVLLVSWLVPVAVSFRLPGEGARLLLFCANFFGILLPCLVGAVRGKLRRRRSKFVRDHILAA